MGIYFRMLFLTLPLFTGLTLFLGAFFSSMFQSEYERAFTQKWTTMAVIYNSFDTENFPDHRANLIKFIENVARPKGLVAVYERKDARTECIWSLSSEHCDTEMTGLIAYEGIHGAIFDQAMGYVYYQAPDKKKNYILVADDSNRDATLVGFYQILTWTLVVSLALSFFLPFLFSYILEKQVLKIGKRKTLPWISELRDLDQTFHIVQESLDDLRKRNSGMLRSGLKLGSYYSDGTKNDQ